MLPTGNQAHNPGMGSDQESNRQSFGAQDDIQSTEPHQPGLGLLFICLFFKEPRRCPGSINDISFFLNALTYTVEKAMVVTGLMATISAFDPMWF